MRDKAQSLGKKSEGCLEETGKHRIVAGGQALIVWFVANGDILDCVGQYRGGCFCGVAAVLFYCCRGFYMEIESPFA